MAVEVGATAEELPKVVEYLCAQAHFSTSTAMEALENIRAI
jgi:alkylhydroperoxidase/carboxymuconolactone decarboxylase family protein YurZ